MAIVKKKVEKKSVVAKRAALKTRVSRMIDEGFLTAYEIDRMVSQKSEWEQRRRVDKIIDDVAKEVFKANEDKIKKRAKATLVKNIDKMVDQMLEKAFIEFS